MNPLMREFDALLAEYRSGLPEKLARLDELLAGGRIADLTRELHTLAGSAGTFGLPQVGEAAHAAESHLRACGGELDPAQRAELTLLLEKLKGSLC